VMFALIVCQIGIAAMIVTRSNDVKTLISNKWDGLDVDHRLQLEDQFSCCGLFAFNDTAAVQPCPTDSDQGCVDRLKDDLHKEMLAVGAAALAFAILEILGVLCACSLASNISSAEEAEDSENERLQQARDVNRTVAVGVQP